MRHCINLSECFEDSSGADVVSRQEKFAHEEKWTFGDAQGALSLARVRSMQLMCRGGKQTERGTAQNSKAPVRNVCDALRVGKKMMSVLEDLICKIQSRRKGVEGVFVEFYAKTTLRGNRTFVQITSWVPKMKRTHDLRQESPGVSFFDSCMG